MAQQMGFRVVTTILRPRKELVDGFRDLSVANVGDAMGRFGIMDYRIKPINKPGVRAVGTALTVRTRAGDNLMVNKALNMARAGDVIVVEAQGSTQNGLWGELMAAYALARGVAGLVIDGGVRDAARIRDMGFPVFARAVVAAGGDKEGPGEVNVSISCGGVPVSPGDIIVADEDGVAVVPARDAESVLEEAKQVAENDEKKLRDAVAGTIDRTWVDKVLAAKGCEIL